MGSTGARQQQAVGIVTKPVVAVAMHVAADISCRYGCHVPGGKRIGGQHGRHYDTYNQQEMNAALIVKHRYSEKPDLHRLKQTLPT